MPPKKAAAEKKTLLGRPGNNLKIGIVGLFLQRVPSCVFSCRFFNQRCAQCRQIVVFQRTVEYQYVTDVDRLHHLFNVYISQVLVLRRTTLMPRSTQRFVSVFTRLLDVLLSSFIFQEARIPVPDERFEWLCDTYKPVSRIPAFLTCIDIAGLTAVSTFVAITRAC